MLETWNTINDIILWAKAAAQSTVQYSAARTQPRHMREFCCSSSAVVAGRGLLDWPMGCRPWRLWVSSSTAVPSNSTVHATAQVTAFHTLQTIQPQNARGPGTTAGWSTHIATTHLLTHSRHTMVQPGGQPSLHWLLYGRRGLWTGPLWGLSGRRLRDVYLARRRALRKSGTGCRAFHRRVIQGGVFCRCG